jgi:DNA-binding MarR family transcriptional regulator
MQVTTLSDDDRAELLTSAALEQIQASMQIVAQSITQAKAHEHLIKVANVRLDRAGIGLLFKLHRSADSSLRITDLAELLGVDAPTVTRKVQQLERLGYVARETDPSDRRVSRIALTKSGRVTLERVLKAHRDRLVRLFGEWTKDELSNFGTLLARFAGELRDEMETYRD